MQKQSPLTYELSDSSNELLSKQSSNIQIGDICCHTANDPRSIVVLFMDNIYSNILYESDTTLLLGYEAQCRGYKVIYSYTEWLSYRDGLVSLFGCPVTLLKNYPYFQIKESIPVLIPLDKVKVVLLRQNPPLNSYFVNNLLLLQILYQNQKIAMIPLPDVLLKFNEKIIPTQIGYSNFCYENKLSSSLVKNATSDLDNTNLIGSVVSSNIHVNNSNNVKNIKIPPTLITNNFLQAQEFLLEQEHCIIKPLSSCGGFGVIPVSIADKNLVTAWNLVKNQYKLPLIIQKFIPNCGDKRIIIAQGEILGAMYRRPCETDFRSNLCFAAQSEPTVLTYNEQKTAELVARFMQDNLIFWAGIDMINEYLIEVNITSPTGLKNMNKIYNVCLEKKLWQHFEEYFTQFYKN